MSMGIYIKGLPLANANGAYNINSSYTTGLDRVWTTVDGLYSIKYVQGDVIYTLTTDMTYDPNKQYYLLVNGVYVLDVDTAEQHRTAAIPTGEVYEQSMSSRWSVMHDNVEYYKYYTTDATSSPYDTVATWEDTDGIVSPGITINYWDDSSFVTETADPVVDEDEGTTTTVTTITNLITGSVHTETTVVRNKTVYVPQELVRYDNVSLSIGKVYRFQFVSDFKQLGYDPANTTVLDNAGIYRVDKVTSYSDIVISGIDLYANLYQPLTIPKEVYEADVTSSISDSIIYRLVDPTDESIVYYMPQSFIEGTPDSSVDQYNKMLLTIDLGVHGDVDLLSDVKETLTQVCEKMWGITADEGKTLIGLTTYDNIWLTLAQKDELDTMREETKNTSTVELVTILQLEQTNAIYLENRRLKGRVGVLEEILTSMSK